MCNRDAGRAEAVVTVTNPDGLHARPAATFVQAAAGFRSRVRVGRDGRWADAKSLLAVLSLAISQGTTVEIVAEGEDAEEAVRALTALVAAAPDQAMGET
jgi:phosphotransferase system HPr (HPr) family protein